MNSTKIKQGSANLIPFLHQTTTGSLCLRCLQLLYLIPFLHQTTTLFSDSTVRPGCILFHFYIKPQPLLECFRRLGVVSYSISTSNHNLMQTRQVRTPVVSYSISTSNHNSGDITVLCVSVVSYSISTSNHNNS